MRRDRYYLLETNHRQLSTLVLNQPEVEDEFNSVAPKIEATSVCWDNQKSFSPRKVVMTAITLNLEPLTSKLTRDQFYALCMANKDVEMELWQALAPEQRQKFPPICPDFVIEL